MVKAYIEQPVKSFVFHDAGEGLRRPPVSDFEGEEHIIEVFDEEGNMVIANITPYMQKLGSRWFLMIPVYHRPVTVKVTW